jgi:5'-3' exonuclease
VGFTGVEADDIIASWWFQDDRGHDAGLGQMAILSGDKDFLQLVGMTAHGMRQVTQIRPGSGDTTTRWGIPEVRAHFGCLPQHLPGVLALAGDTSDNVIGVPDIGPKRAVKALQEADWSFERCVATRWPDRKDQLHANYRLVDLRSGWRHEKLPAPPPPPEMHLTAAGDALWPRLMAFLERYELAGIEEQIRAQRLWTSQPPAPQVGRPLRARS